MTSPKNSEPNTESSFQFANSTRIYVEGSRPDIRVPMREIHLNLTRSANGAIEGNQPVVVYDSSGPWGDPEARRSVHDGLAAVRREWIIARGDVEEYEGRKV